VSLARVDVGMFRHSFLQVYFMQDQNVLTTTRTVYSLVDALSDTGGFTSVLNLIFFVLTSRIQKLLYELAMIQKFFFRKKS